MKKQRKIPARQQLCRPPAPTVASLVTGPFAQPQVSPKKLAKTIQKAHKKFSKGSSLGYMGKEEPGSESNAGVSAPGMYDARPVRRPSNAELEASLGGEPLRNPLESVPRIKSDPNLLPVDN